MKYILSTLLAFMLTNIAGTPTANAARMIVSSVGQSQAVLGTGYRADEESWAEECVSGDKDYTGRQEGDISFTSTIAHSMLAKELGFQAHTKAKWGAASMSAAANFLNQSKSSSHSIVAVYKGDYAMRNEYLTNIVEKPKMGGPGKKLSPDCGDAYVKEIGRGAKLFFSIRVDFVSEEQKRKFSAAASYSSSAFSISAAVKNSKESFDSRSKVTVSAFQLGGDVRNLSHIFGSNTMVEGTEKPLALISCTFGDYDECDSALDSALKYAQKEFPDQLKTNENDPDLGPANLFYVVQPYEGHSPAVSEALKANRKVLEDILNEQTEILSLANNATRNRVYPLAPSQKIEAENILDTVIQNISVLKILADECYNYLDKCDSNAATARKILVEIQNKRVSFPPISFLQFCGNGYYVDPDQNRQLHETILTMLEVAKKINPDAFVSKTNQGLNMCEAANGIFKSQKTFSVASLNNEMGKYQHSSHIYTLDPFIDLTHFIEVDLSGQRLIGMENVTYFKRAIKIDLSNNEIRSVSNLSQMIDLEDLSLGGNLLRTLEGLGTPAHISRIDIRNNIIDLECPTLATLKVCIKKSYGGRLGASVVGADIPRMMIQPAVTVLQDGRVYMSSGTDTILYNPKTHEKTVGASMRHSRLSHTATLLKDGRVLVVGGSGGGQTSAEVYNPFTNQYTIVSENIPSRAEHTATLLNDGRVMIAGGYDITGSIFMYRPTTTVSIFDPTTGKLENVGNLILARAAHTATLLPDNRVWLIGGYTRHGGQRMTEIFDPATNESTTYISLNEGRFGHSTTLLPDGKILVAGGLEKEGVAIRTLEYYDTNKKVFKYSYEPMKTGRAFHTATLIDSGQVIFTGGSNIHYSLLVDDGNSSKSCTPQIEIYTPEEESFTDLGRISLSYSRAMHRAVITQQGMIYIIGGADAHSGRAMELISYGGLSPL